MKILILDDEPILRQGIINQIKRSGLEVRIIGEAGDGASGLELVRELAPDIVITDIRMPGMDGIAFIEQAQRINGKLEFIVVSGYSDFEYAKRAIRLGVSDYLLKPVEDEELKDSLTRMMSRIEERRSSRNEMNRLRKETHINRETLRQQYMTRMLHQAEQPYTSTAERDEQLSRIETKYGHYLAVVLMIEPIRLPNRSFRSGDESLIWFAVQNILSERIAVVGRDGVLFRHVLHDRESVYLLGIDNRSRNPEVKAWLEEVLYGLQTYLKLEVTIAMGTIVDRIGQVQQSYHHAKQAIRNKMVHGTGRIYDYESLQKQSGERSVLLTEEDESKLFYWLKECSAEALQGWIGQRIQSLAQAPSSTYMQLEWLCADLYLVFRKYLLTNSSVTDWIIGEMDDLLHWLQNLSQWQDAAQQMQRIAANIVGHLTQHNRASNKDLMEEVRRHIEACFDKHLTLQSISERFFIHPNYFTRRFKEKYGQSFVDYLTSIRMRKAADWLRETDIKIQDIANRVGFEEASYFSNVFRKYYGMTPKQYREQIQAQST